MDHDGSPVEGRPQEKYHSDSHLWEHQPVREPRVTEDRAFHPSLHEAQTHRYLDRLLVHDHLLVEACELIHNLIILGDRVVQSLFHVFLARKAVMVFVAYSPTSFQVPGDVSGLSPAFWNTSLLS